VCSESLPVDRGRFVVALEGGSKEGDAGQRRGSHLVSPRPTALGAAHNIYISDRIQKPWRCPSAALCVCSFA